MSAALRVGIYPGTFDPITVGHMDIIRRALKVVDKLVVGVAEDTAKDTMFSPKERADMVRGDIALLPASDSARAEVMEFSGLLVNFAESIGAGVIIRGLRAVSDFDYEFQMTCMNYKLKPSIETVFLTASENTHFISSRFVRQVSLLGGDVSCFVSEAVKGRLKSRL